MVYKKKPQFVICSYHKDYPTPLVFTFAFPFNEYWCPYCDAKYGFLEPDDVAESTPELENRALKYAVIYKDYLRALGSLECALLEYPEGSKNYIKPSELPPDIVKHYMEVKEAGWTKFIKVEELENMTGEIK